MTDYGESHIFTMDALKHIREYTSRYLGEFDTPKGHVHTIKEIVDNCIDEAVIAPDREHNIRITVVQCPKSIQVIVVDQGRGIPLKSLVAAFSEPRTSGKWSGAYTGTAGCHGEGAKGVSAISKRFLAITRRPGEGIGCVEICDGAVTRAESNTRNKNQSNPGTLVYFETDPKFMTTAGSFSEPDGGSQILVELLEFLGVFIPNVTIFLYKSDVPIEDSVFSGNISEMWDFLSAYGLDRLVLRTEKQSPRAYITSKYRIRSPIIWELTGSRKLQMENEEDKVGIEYDIFATATLDQVIVSSVNLIPISDMGSFQIVFMCNTIKERLAQFVTNKEVRNFFVTHYKLPICGSINLRVRHPKFVGQTKDQYRDKEIVTPLVNLLKTILPPTNNDVWSSLYGHLEDHINQEYTNFISKGMTTAQGLKNVGLRLNKPSRYSDCDSKNPEITELFITEGTSAGGTVAQVRDPAYQAVFNMVGKSLNAIRCDLSDLSSNLVLQDLIMILGIRPGAKDLSGLNFGKIIILTDADSDGQHIAALLIGFLFTLSPKLFEEKKVFIANPPLYSLSLGKNKVYLKDNHALMDVRIRSVYSKCLDIELRNVTSGKRKRLSGEDYRSFIYAISHVGNLIETLGNILTVEPVYMEALATVVDFLEPDTMDTNRLQRELKVDRVVYYRESNSLTLTSKELDVTIPLSGLAKHIRSELIPELSKLAWTQIIPWVKFVRCPEHQGQPMTLYQLYHCLKELNGIMPIDRYKGLGEMPPAELAKACVDPATRSHFSISSLGDVDRLYAVLGTDPAYRKQMLRP